MHEMLKLQEFWGRAGGREEGRAGVQPEGCRADKRLLDDKQTIPNTEGSTHSWRVVECNRLLHVFVAVAPTDSSQRQVLQRAAVESRGLVHPQQRRHPLAD